MKTFSAVVCFGVVALHCSAQNSQAQGRSEEDRIGIFKQGTVIGKTADEITATTVFGRPNAFKRTGRYGMPTCLDYWVSTPSQIPYSHEFGFFADGKTAYVIYTKMPLERLREINDAEVTGLLLKAARGGQWSPQTGQFSGTAYLYTHEVDNQKFELLAFRTLSKKTLIVYHPTVTPNLNGPGGLGGLAYVFADGQQIVWAEGDGDDMMTAYIDAKSPAPLAQVAANPSAEGLERLSAEIGKLASENKVSLFTKPAFENFKTVAKYSAVAAKGPLSAGALNDLKKVTVWGEPLKIGDSTAAKDLLEGAKYELLNKTPLASPVTNPSVPEAPRALSTPK